MPFQSEKQRRYLWANEPEIARDWTDTYGSKIQKANGGRIGFARGSDPRALKQRFIEVIRLMNEAEGDELAALALEARTLKEQLKVLEQIEPSVGQGIQSLQRPMKPQGMALLPKEFPAPPPTPDDPGYQIFPPGYGRERIFPGISTEPILDLEVRKQKPIYQAAKRSMDRNTTERLEEMFKSREMLERHRPSRADGGIMHHFQNYAQNDGNNVSVPRSFQARPHSETVNLAYITPQEQQMLQALKPGTPHRGPMEIPNYDSFDAAGGYSNPGGAGDKGGYSASSGGGGGGWQASHRADAKVNEMAEQVRRNYVNKENIKSSPLHDRGLGFTGSGGGIKNFLGNWGSGVAGSRIGGGLGSMLFGPWGMLLGSIFGGKVGQRAYKASQTDEEETLRDIMLGQNTLLSNLFTKPTTRGEGIKTIDIRDKFDRRGDDFDITEERFAFKPNSPKDKRLRTLHNQKTEGLFWNEQNQKEYEQLLKEDAEQTDYPKSVII